ncbi:hypothetical protein ONZ45_g14025 [Pleurotus djamor]|nr:hypothetical protein ONZ45_g14025 [Pleurotus djamor]
MMSTIFRKLTISVVLLSAFCGFVNAVDVRNSDGGKGKLSKCRNTLVRKEWRDLSSEDKARYIGAVKCIQALPAKTTFPAVKTRFDDFQALHVHIMADVHLVGQFFPWHRRFLQSYEEALRDECGYSGAQPFWDWTRDADNATSVAGSPIFHPIFGFGGNGDNIPGYTGLFGNLTFLGGWTGGGCVRDGPFASYTLSIGPGTLTTSHCLTRSFNTEALKHVRTEGVEYSLNQPNFEKFRVETEGIPVTEGLRIHDGGHLAIGGELGDMYSSPADPLFYLHHANLDRVWWLWQAKDLSKRLEEISGYTTFTPPFTNVTLDFKLKMDKLGALMPIRDVMDIRASPMCYEYAY